MPSLSVRLLPPILRRTLKRRLAGDSPLEVQRRAMLRWAKLGWLPRRTRIVRLILGGRPAERFESLLGCDRQSPVLLLHGGGYCWGGLDTHRELAARIARAAQRPVYVVDYRRAPEHPYPAAVDDAVAAYRELATTTDVDRIALVGDSAGGGLALATMLRCRDSGLRQPRQAALISPWTDLTQSGASITALAEADPLISPSALDRCADHYAAGRPRETPELSPLFADLSGLPPLYIQVASNEVLLDDATRLAARCQTQGISAELRVTADLWHVWHLFATAVPEAREAIADLGAFLSRRP